ncbi:MAG: NUDIX hydrolase [Patescibacteria group bacterium]
MKKNFCSGIHILIQKGNQYLLLYRNPKDKEDPKCWDLPGGGIHFGEQPLKAAIREAKEETGIDIKITKILALGAMPYRGAWSIGTTVAGKYCRGKIRLSKEHTDYKWVSKRELRSIKPKSENLESLFKYSL